jgi:pyridoxine kinase
MPLKPKGHQRVLSIQSHVTFGYVGGKAATFPLQCLGYDVDVVNTVHFSNHAGYRRHGGRKTTAEELAEMFQSMKQNEMIIAGRLLTGFIPDPESLSEVAKLATELRESYPDLIYVLDPVLGDAGRMYVEMENLTIYRTMLPLATAISPNWYEAELLTGTKIQDFASLRKVISIFHEEYRVPNVVISSIPLKQWLLDALPQQIRPSGDVDILTPTDYLLCVCSLSTIHTTFKSVVHARVVPLIPGYYSGVGDLFSALLLGHYHTDFPSHLHQSETPLSHATSQALAKTHDILNRTYEYSKSLPEEERQATDDEKDATEKRPEVQSQGFEKHMLSCMIRCVYCTGLHSGKLQTMWTFPPGESRPSRLWVSVCENWYG